MSTGPHLGLSMSCRVPELIKGIQSVAIISVTDHLYNMSGMPSVLWWLFITSWSEHQFFIYNHFASLKLCFGIDSFMIAALTSHFNVLPGRKYFLVFYLLSYLLAYLVSFPKYLAGNIGSIEVHQNEFHDQASSLKWNRWCINSQEHFSLQYLLTL